MEDTWGKQTDIHTHANTDSHNYTSSQAGYTDSLTQPCKFKTYTQNQMASDITIW